jgi:hypothetical protein
MGLTLTLSKPAWSSGVKYECNLGWEFLNSHGLRKRVKKKKSLPKDRERNWNWVCLWFLQVSSASHCHLTLSWSGIYFYVEYLPYSWDGVSMQNVDTISTENCLEVMPEDHNWFSTCLLYLRNISEWLHLIPLLALWDLCYLFDRCGIWAWDSKWLVHGHTAWKSPSWALTLAGSFLEPPP